MLGKKGQYMTEYRNLWYWVYLIDCQVRIVTAEDKLEVIVESFDDEHDAWSAYHSVNLALSNSILSLAEIINIHCRKPYGKPPMIIGELPGKVQSHEVKRMLAIKKA